MSTQSSAAEPVADSSNLPAAGGPGRYASFDGFILDVSREELYRNGQRLRVQGKVLQALLLLVSKAGHVISRDDLRQRLWPASIAADSDANVNTAMNKLRHMLEDSATNPVYVETIPRRGYCFVAALQFSDAPNIAPPRPLQLPSQGSRPSAPLQDASSPPDVSRLVFRAVSLLIAGMVVGALMMIAWSFLSGKISAA